MISVSSKQNNQDRSAGGAANPDRHLALILHHVRTPLTGMMWGLKELWRESSDEKGERKSLLFRMYQESSRVLSDIDRLLATFRASNGEVSCRLVLTDIKTARRLIIEGLSQMLPSAREKHIQFDIQDIEQDFYEENETGASEKHLLMDAGQVVSIVQTLFENAVAYTDSGGKISVALREEIGSGAEGKGEERGRKNRGYFVFEIRDTGIGIPEKDRGKIFLEFSRAENAERKIPAGYGIGLFLAKTFVEVHGGTIGFAPNEQNGGGGTVFTVRFPLAGKEESCLTEGASENGVEKTTEPLR